MFPPHHIKDIFYGPRGKHVWGGFTYQKTGMDFHNVCAAFDSMRKRAEKWFMALLLRENGQK